MCRGVYLHLLCGAQAELHLRILKKSFAPCCADLLYSFYHFWIPAHAVIAMLYFDNIFSQSQHYGWQVTKTKISVALLYFFVCIYHFVCVSTTLKCIYQVVCVFTSTVKTLFLFLLLCLCIYYFGWNSLDLTVTLYSGRPRLTMQWCPAAGQGRLKCISTDFVFCIFRNLCFVQVLWILNFHKPAWHIFLVEMQHLRCRWFRLKSEEMVGGFYKLVGGRRLLLGDRLLLY